MSTSLKLIKEHASDPKLWLVIGVGVAGIVVLAETRRRRRRGNSQKQDFGAFVERFEILPFPQPPPPAAKQTLSSLTFAIKDIFDVKSYVTGFGNPDWNRTHEAAEKTAIVVTALLKNGATCVGKTVMDELSLGISGENQYYGTPTNPQMPSCIPGGSSSGSAVAVAAGLVDFAIDQAPKHMNLCQYITSKVPSLRLHEQSTYQQNGPSVLKVLSSVMLTLQGYEFKTNHEEWIQSVKPKFGRDVSGRVIAAINTSHDNIKTLYKVRTEMRATFQNLLKDGGILVIPTVADSPLKLNTKKGLSSEFYDRTFALSSIASMTGCCQVTIPLGYHNDCCVSVSLISFHGSDKFLLDTVLDMYTTLQEQVSVASSLPLPDTNGNMETSELLKEKGNAAFKGRQWNKAVNYYTEAIKLNGMNMTYHCNRAAAYLKLGCFQQAEEDCSEAILHDKKISSMPLFLNHRTRMLVLLRKDSEN
ncbi:unnamed protein product [Lupinus luteus]|uniref:Uncharacterized protein n=1 Tax=Lupinus luteus TaxID=3873 RepID=A0AAV1WRL7_LUPLU